MITLSLLSPSSCLVGYGGSDEYGPDTGGIVVAGFGDVSAYTLAAAVGSAMQLNSATGVMFPGSFRVPPMTTTSLAFMNVFGSFAAAMAKVVSGPMAIKVMVSAGFSLRIRRISSGEWLLEAVNKSVWDDGFVWVALTAVEERRVAVDGVLKRWDQVSETLLCCGCLRLDQQMRRLLIIVIIPTGGHFPSHLYHLMFISRKA